MTEFVISRQERYEAGIALARKSGAIREHGTPQDDFFSHLDRGLDGSNTRPLRRVVSAVAKTLQTGTRRRALRCLELGPGCGRAAGELRLQVGADARIETVGRTPFNPYLRLRMSPIEIGRMAEELHQDPGQGTTERRLLEPVRGVVLGLRMETLMALYESGLMDAFEEWNEPYVDMQHIGELEDVSGIGTFDMVFEDNGPFRHTKDMPADFCRALALTADDGVLVLSPFGDPEVSGISRGLLQKLLPFLRPDDTARVLPNAFKPSESDLVVARGANPLQYLLRPADWRERVRESLQYGAGYFF